MLLFLVVLHCRPSYAVDVPLYWTAPGDDCAEGRAFEYQLVKTRDSSMMVALLATDRPGGNCDSQKVGIPRDSIVLRVPGLLWQSTSDGTMPVPDSAGTDQTALVSQLGHGVWYVALRTLDEAGNASPWAPNRLEVDAIEPAAIFDLRH